MKMMNLAGMSDLSLLTHFHASLMKSFTYNSLLLFIEYLQACATYRSCCGRLMVDVNTDSNTPTLDSNLPRSDLFFLIVFAVPAGS